jgi:hypothetical protein
MNKETEGSHYVAAMFYTYPETIVLPFEALD